MASGGARIDTGNWLSRALSPSGEPPPWPEAIRAAVAFGVVVAVALALGEPDAVAQTRRLRKVLPL